MSKKTILDEPNQHKVVMCDLCGVAGILGEDIHGYCGGYLNFAHQRCAEIGDKAIACYETHKKYWEAVKAKREKEERRNLPNDGI